MDALTPSSGGEGWRRTYRRPLSRTTDRSRYTAFVFLSPNLHPKALHTLARGENSKLALTVSKGTPSPGSLRNVRGLYIRGERSATLVNLRSAGRLLACTKTCFTNWEGRLLGDEVSGVGDSRGGGGREFSSQKNERTLERDENELTASGGTRHA